MEASDRRRRSSFSPISMRQTLVAFPAMKCFPTGQCSTAFAAPIDPMLTIYAAVTRRTLDGKHPQGWVPEQKISVAEALRAYTVGSAFAEFQEKEKGTITPGKLADLVILSQDILKIDPNEIEK